MTNKLVVIMNSLKVQTIKKILLYEMKFLVPNYSCLSNPWLGGYRPHIPVLPVLCPQLNLLNPPHGTKIPEYTTEKNIYHNIMKAKYSWFQTFVVFWMLYSFFWVIPRRLNFMRRRFGTACLFQLNRLCRWNRVFRNVVTWNLEIVASPKRKNTRHIYLW